jgi:hypothetical protein
MVSRDSTYHVAMVRGTPALPIARNTALLSAAMAVHSAMIQLAAAVASITLVGMLEVEAPAVRILRDSAAVSRQVGAQATASGTRRA